MPAREQIVDAALKCFTENGFHGTAVEDIAALAETSRATLYQYFESKQAIFIELMRECASALSRVLRRIGPLGPTAEGYDNLHWWLGEWAWVFDRYSAMFIELAHVNTPKTPLRADINEFAEMHSEHFAARIDAAGYEGPDSTAAALLVLAVTKRFNLLRHVYRPGPSDDALLASLATGLQLFLFPDTPAPVLEAGPHSADAVRTAHREVPPIHRIGPLATLPPRDSVRKSTPFDGLSPQAERTARALLDAAGRVFAASGYVASNIDQIVTEAGVARGTFYRYFTDKQELIVALAHETATVFVPLLAELESFGHDVDPAKLREWLGRYLQAHRRYAGVVRVFTEAFPLDDGVLAAAADLIAQMARSVQATFGPVRPYPLIRRATGLMTAALLEEFPNEGVASKFELSDDTIVEMQALFLERVLFAGTSEPPRVTAGRRRR